MEFHGEGRPRNANAERHCVDQPLSLARSRVPVSLICAACRVPLKMLSCTALRLGVARVLLRRDL